jgi:nucleotide-binding universal stress UspA family protein
MDASPRVTRPVATRAPPLDPPMVQDDGSVLLATFDVPFDEAASSFAVAAAVDSGRTLIVANVVELPPLPLSVRLGSDLLEYTPELAASLLRPVEQASALGVKVERLRVKSFRRVEALLEVASERHVRLLVLGPDRTKVSRRLFNKAAAAVRERLDCLVWLSWDIPAG